MNGKQSGVGEAFVALRMHADKLSSDMLRMRKTIDSALGQNYGSSLGKQFGRGFGNALTDSIKSQFTRLNDLLGKGLIGAGIGAGAFTAWGLKLSADAEMAQTTMSVMLGSAEKAKTLLAELKKFAIETPFENTELRDAAKNLLAMGYSAEEVIPTLKKLGDISAGLGLPLTEVSQLYATMRVQGTLMTQDIRQWTQRGVPLIKELSKQFNVAESEIFKLAEKGVINFSHLEKAINSLTGEGGNFADLMVKASATVVGQASNIRDQFAELAISIGTGLMPAIKELFGNISQSMPQIQAAAKEAGIAIAELFSVENIRSFAGEMVNVVDSVKLMAAYFAEAQLGVLRLTKAAVRFSVVTQAWRLAGNEDAYAAAMQAFDAGVQEAAMKATMVDPKTGERVNRTDYIEEHFGEREPTTSTPYVAPRGPIESEQKSTLPWLDAMQNELKKWADDSVAALEADRAKYKVAPYRVPEYQPPPVPPEPKRMALEGHRFGFAEMNSAIQNKLLESPFDAVVVQAKQGNALAKQGNDLLKGVKKATEKWTPFAR